MEKIYDVLIIGGGVAGMSAAIYAKRSGKNVAIIEKFVLGGQVLSLNRIQNFPSQTEIDGFTLAQMFTKQVKELNVEIISDDVVSVDFSRETKLINCKKGILRGNSVVIATGMSSVELGVNENDFLGRGVSYCAVCDANFYKDRPVCVASKKGSGIKDALLLSKIASKVTVLDSEDLSVYAKANKVENLEVVSNVNIKNVQGQSKLEKIDYDHNGKIESVVADALFVELGKKPATKLFEGILELDEKGFIKTDENMETSIKGVFAAGDVRASVLKQIVTACGDGAIAGQKA